MTVKISVSLTDQQHAFAMRLIEEGVYPSLSAVLQDGLRLVRRDREEHEARLHAIRDDLDRRAAGPMISLDELEAIRKQRWSREDETPRDA